MVEGVFELHPAVREALFAGVALGGRVDRHQAAVKGMPDQQVAGPELALDEHEIAGRGLLVEPGENRPHPGEQALLVRRHVRPASAQLGRGLRHLGHAQFEPGPGQLPGRDLVVEKKKVGMQFAQPAT